MVTNRPESARGYNDKGRLQDPGGDPAECADPRAGQAHKKGNLNDERHQTHPSHHHRWAGGFNRFAHSAGPFQDVNFLQYSIVYIVLYIYIYSILFFLRLLSASFWRDFLVDG